jgi:hypothetical protein
MLFQRLNRCPARVNLNLKYYLALLSEPESIIIIITKINRDRDDERHGGHEAVIRVGGLRGSDGVRVAAAAGPGTLI